MTMEESNKLQELLNHIFFVDSRQIASAEYRSMPTCYVGPNGGSRIGFLLTTPNIYDLLSNFTITQLPVFKDHGLVTVQLAMPAPVQSRISLKHVPKLPPLRAPARDDQLPTCEIDQEFHISLTQGLVDNAFKILAHELNRLLIEIASRQGHQISKAGTDGGKIQFHAQRRHPPAIGPHASTLFSRKIYKALNQAMEVSVAKPGWNKFHSGCAFFPLINMLHLMYFSVSLLLNMMPMRSSSS